MNKQTKCCPGCRETKNKTEFVTVYGFANPRGKYCRSCFDEKELENVRSLMEGRDFCLYCGRQIARYCDYSPTGGSVRTYIHCDHMDPVSKGGLDTTVRDKDGYIDIKATPNIVYCCAECNEQKWDMPFAEWLKTLQPKYAELARSVYVAKNGRQPEDFKEPEPIVLARIDLQSRFKSAKSD